MRVVDDVRAFDEVLPNVVLTVGSFDGIHRGHRRIVEELLLAARARAGTAAVMTLHPHPRQVFAPRHAPNILTCQPAKVRLLEEAGVDVLFILPFNAEVAALSPQAFLEEIVLGHCHAKKLVVGHDFAFGKDAGGDFEYLERVAPDYDLEVCQVPPLVIHGERVSSTLIRERVLQGDVEGIGDFLGRKYAMSGKVMAGRGIGKKLGFPTANLETRGKAVPAHGVYAAQTIVDGVTHNAAVNVGVAPTIRQEDILVEAFIFDFDGDITGQEIDVVFHKRLRPEKKFGSVSALIAAIDADVNAIRAYFAGLA